jgi:hypothetical protein
MSAHEFDTSVVLRIDNCYITQRVPCPQMELLKPLPAHCTPRFVWSAEVQWRKKKILTYRTNCNLEVLKTTNMNVFSRSVTPSSLVGNYENFKTYKVKAR